MAYVRDPNVLTPIMTSNTAPSGTVIADNGSSSSEAYKAFNGVVSASDYCIWSSASSGYIEYDFTNAVVSDNYNLYCPYDVNGFKDWTYRGWNGSAWVVLDTRTNQTGWSTTVAKKYTCSNTTAYSKYRLFFTANGGSTNTAVGEFEICGSSSSTLRRGPRMI